MAERRKLRGSSNAADSMFGSASGGQSVNDILGANGFFNDTASKQMTEAMRNQKRVAVNAIEQLDNFFGKLSQKTKAVEKETVSGVESAITKVYDELHKVEDRIIEVANTGKNQVKSLEKQLRTTTDKEIAKGLREKIKDVKEDTREALLSLKDDAKGFKEQVKGIETQFNATAKAVDKGVDMLVDKMGLARGGLVHNLGKDVAKQFADNMGKVSKLQIAKMAATAISVASLAQASAFQASGRDLITSTGMGMDQYNKFLDIAPRVGISARITNQEVMQLGHSFANVGIPLNSATKDLQGYMTVAGQAMRMTGLNSDQVAIYTKNLMAQGLTSNQVGESFKTLYGTMVGTNQTTKDLVESLGVAADLVGDFGGIGHRNMFQFTNDIMLARGLFKTLGIDAKEAGNIISSSFGNNGQTALMRSGLIANTLGGNNAAIFNQMMSDPSKGAEMTLQSAMTKLTQLAPTAGMSYEQLHKKFGGNQEAIRSEYLRNMQMLPAVAGMHGLDAKVLQQGLSNYRSSGATSIQSWMDQRRATMQPQNKAWDKAWDNFNSQVPELTEQIGRIGQNLMIIIGSPVIRLLIPLLKGTNAVLDKVAEFMTSNNPLVKGLITFGSAMTGVFGIVLPLVSLFRAIMPMLGAVTGTGLLGGLAAGGLMPVLIGGAITAAVAGVMVAFGPQIVKAIGDGFNTAVSWLKSLNPFGGGGVTGGSALPAPTWKMPSMPNFMPGIMGGGVKAPAPVAPKTGGINAPGMASSHPFGWLSAKYESGNAGTVADYMFRGRHNVAYGAWQMDAGMNTPQAYMKWAKQHDPATYGYLNPAIGSAMQAKHGAFGQRWMQMGKEHPTEFKQSQLMFMKERYLNPLITRFGSGALANPYIQEAAFSTAVQHGPGSNGRSGGADILQRAGLGQISDANQLIRNIFAERTRVHPGTADRYNREMLDVLKAMAQDANRNHAQVQQLSQAQHTDNKLEQRRTAAANNINAYASGNF